MAARSKIRVEKPKTNAAIISERIAQGIFSKIDDLVKKLQTSADAGNKEARDKLNFFRWGTMRDLMRDLEKMSKAGQHSSPPPIRTILEMADFSIPLLLWLSEHQRENIKKYARNRWGWPGYFHLLKNEQSRYQDLLPVFNQTGTQITQSSPIELGKNLGMNLNANRTSGDYLFLISANAVFDVAHLEEKEGIPFPKTWMMSHDKSFHKLRGGKINEKIEQFLLSLGKFTRTNWPKWKPVFDTYLIYFYAPPEIKFKKLPKFFQENMATALETGTEKQWFENFRKRKNLTTKEELEFLDYLKKVSRNIEPLQKKNRPEIAAIGGKSEKAKWNALKRELLNRICKLAPKD